MVIFHSYVKLPEGIWTSPEYDLSFCGSGSPIFTCSVCFSNSIPLKYLLQEGFRLQGLWFPCFFFEGWGEKDHGVLKHVREEAGALELMANGTKPKMPFTTLDCLVVFFASSIFGMMILNDIVLVEITKTTNQWTGLALCCGSDIPVPLCGSHVTLTSEQFQSQFFLCCLELVIELLTC